MHLSNAKMTLFDKSYNCNCQNLSSKQPLLSIKPTQMKIHSDSSETDTSTRKTLKKQIATLQMKRSKKVELFSKIFWANLSSVGFQF